MYFHGAMRDFADFGGKSGENAEAAMLIASLREVIRSQASQIEELQTKLQDTENARVKEVLFHFTFHWLGKGTQTFFQISELQAQMSSITLELEELKQKHANGEKEQEDLLVFLDELQAKRRRDKEKLRTAGQEVSDDEDADDGEETDAE